MPRRLITAPVGRVGVVGVALLVRRRDLGASFSGWSLTLNVLRTPPLRATSTLTTSPGWRNPMICWSWPTYSTGLPSTATMMSPGSMPAALAGESSLGMSLTTTPADLGQADVGRVVEVHVVDRDAERRAVDLAVGDQLVHHRAGQVDRNGEAVAGVEARSRWRWRS